MNRQAKTSILMVGPDLSLRGGIVSVVKGYLDAELPEKCEKFEYLSTGVGTGLASKCFAFARSLVSFSRLLDSYEIVHLHMGPKGSFVRKSIMARIAKMRNKRVVLHEHSGEFARDFDNGNAFYRRNVLNAFSIVDKVIVLSEEWREYFRENICDESKIYVLNNGVALPDKVCKPAHNQDILFLGRLDTRKSPDVLLRAAQPVLQRYPSAKLIFAGDGYPDRYRALADELCISDRCEFHDWVSGNEKEMLFNRAGIFCLPSKNEGMPMSVLEAMAHGIPVVSTDVGGIPQVICDGVSGFLMSVDDERTLTRLLMELEGSSILREKVGLAGREVIEAKFSIDTSVRNLIDLYCSILSE